MTSEPCPYCRQPHGELDPCAGGPCRTHKSCPVHRTGIRCVVITGAIADPRSGEKVPRPTFAKLVEKAGATVASSVSGTTDMLICGANVGAAKTTKAEKLGVEVRDQDAIWQQLIAAAIV